MIQICEVHPWHDVDFTATVQNEKGWMTAEGFVAQWL